MDKGSEFRGKDLRFKVDGQEFRASGVGLRA
jgi:hypothetical protein